MARAPNASGIFDIRTAAILQDIYYASEPCKHGLPLKMHEFDNLYGESTLNDIRRKTDQKVKRLKYDSPRNWVQLLSSIALIGTILGIVQSQAVFFGAYQLNYKIGTVEACVISISTNAVLIFFNPIASCLINWAGLRVTAMLGMFLFFVGLVLDGLVLHTIVLYVSHIFFMAVGGSFVYTAALSSVVDNFRVSLPIALLLLGFAAPTGTIFYYLSLAFLITRVSYTWTLNSLAILILVLTGVTNSYPNKPAKDLPDPFCIQNKSRVIKECLKKSNHASRNCIPERGEDRSEKDKDPNCLCVCIMDVNILTDMSGLLWSTIAMFSLFPVFVPYLFVVMYAWQFDPLNSPPITLIVWFCLATAVGRSLAVVRTKHSFNFNKTAFQVTCIASGISYVTLMWTTSFGWIFIWCIVAGILDGTLITIIPRLTLQTIPRGLVCSSWGFMVFMSAIGVFSGPILVLCTWNITGTLTTGFISVGVCQIVAGIIAILLPNEEKETIAFVEKSLSPFSGPAALSFRNISSGRDQNQPNSKYRHCCSHYSTPSSFLPPCMEIGMGLGQSYSSPSGCPVCRILGNVEGCSHCSNTRISDRYFANKSSPVSPIPRANATEIPIVTPTSNSVIQQEKGFQLSYDTTSDEKQDRVKYAGEQRPIPTFSAHALDRRDTPRPDPEEVKKASKSRINKDVIKYYGENRPIPNPTEYALERRPTPFKKPSEAELSKLSVNNLTKDVVKYKGEHRPVPNVTKFALERRSTPAVLPSSEGQAPDTSENADGRHVSFVDLTATKKAASGKKDEKKESKSR